MTDAEILKALECCMQDDAPLEVVCSYCPIKQDRPNCVRKLLSDSLDLIKRQKAEIERLKTMHSEMCIGMKTLKKKARKEFAERLKAIGTKVEGGKGFEGVYVMANNLQIDNLLEEMEGGTLCE